MKTKIVAVLGAAVTLAALAVPGAAQASTLGICDTSASVLCLSTLGSGDNVYTDARSGAVREEFNFTADDVCSGTDVVHSVAHGDAANCPFTDVSLDNQLWPNAVAHIQATGYSNVCALGHSTSGVDAGACSAGGNAWVQSGASAWVNVARSDDRSSTMSAALCSDGTAGDQAVASGFTAGNCNWQLVSN